jgi:hypothetical protein
VAIMVNIHLAATPGLRPEPVGDIRIPSQSSRSQIVPAEVIRAGRFTVDIDLTTPSGGTELGETSRLELASTSYGVVTIALTGVAGGVLVLLVAFRIFRRVRGARAGPADGAPSGEGSR